MCSDEISCGCRIVEFLVLQASDGVSVGSRHAGSDNSSAVGHLARNTNRFIDKDATRRCGEQLGSREDNDELSAVVWRSDFHYKVSQ